MAEKKQQILNLTPSSEMVFKGPFNDVVTADLKLANPTNDTVIFKVKTTAPKQYCVRPNSGLLNPQEDTIIAVMLQPFDPIATDTQKHKFMVQTMIAPPDFTMEQLDNVWKLAAKSDLMDSKLKCTFVNITPSDDPVLNDEEPTSTTKSPEVAEEMFTSILPSDSPKPSSDDDRSPTSQPTAGSTPGHQKQDKNQVERETMETKLRQMQQKLDKMMTENTQLKGEVNKLRQRVTVAGSAAAGKIKPQISHSSSSPLNIVAIMLILVAIILGYLVGKWL